VDNLYGYAFRKLANKKLLSYTVELKLRDGEVYGSVSFEIQRLK
jgi:hypothetical protein